MDKGKEITDSKRKLILFLTGGERSGHDIREHLDVSKGRVSQMTTEMNDAGMLLSHDVRGERMWQLDRDNLITEHSSDMYIPDIAFTTVVLVSALFLTAFVPIWFVFGALFATFFVFFRVFWKIMKHPDYVKFYHKPVAEEKV